ncbi:MAG: transposase, partial [Anaerolineae bacterium]
TGRLFNGRQVRKTLAFSKDVAAYRAAAAWEDAYYNLVRPHKSLRLLAEDGSPRKRLPRMPAMAAELSDHIWTVKELLTMPPIPDVNNA